MTAAFFLAFSIIPAIISITCLYIKREELRRCFKGKLFILVYVVGAMSFFSDTESFHCLSARSSCLDY